MKTSIAKSTISLIKEFIDKNYFFDNESIQTQIRNRDRANEKGQDVSMYPDELIRKIVRGNTLRQTFYHTALPLYNAIKEKDKKFLSERLRYDQKVTIKLFELYSGERPPKTNKEIQKYIAQL